MVIEVFITETNLRYSHSPRRNTLFHTAYSKPRPAVQPIAKSLVLSCDAVSDCDGTGSVGPIVVTMLPRAFVVVVVSCLVVVLVTLRGTSIRPTARPPNA